MLFGRRNRFSIWVCLFGFIIFATGCGKNSTTGNISGGRDVMRLPGVATGGQFDPGDETKEGVLSVITAIDLEKQMITLKVIDSRSVELAYTGATDIRDDIGQVIAATQLQLGEVVYADYEAGVNRLKRLEISSDNWREEVSGVDIHTDGSYVEYGKKKYTYDNNLIVISGNTKGKIEDIEQIDQLLIRGRDKKIDSIVIKRGHGYLQLQNTGFYEGGIIEVGNEVITGITRDMKLLVPEGTYRLTVTKGQDTGSKEIVIGRNEEQTVNLAELQKTGERYGNLGFEIVPENANLYIDRKKIEDYSKMVEVSYGEHEITVTGEGYETYTTTVNVDTVYQSVVIELNPSEVDTGNVEESSKEQETATKDAKEQHTSKKEETTTQETTTISLADIVSDILE